MSKQKSAEMDLMQKVVSLSKRRGFVFQSSEIYGGVQGFWDYGPLGVELKRNLKCLVNLIEILQIKNVGGNVDNKHFFKRWRNIFLVGTSQNYFPTVDLITFILQRSFK